MIPCPLSDRVFTVGLLYEALKLNAKRAIDMGNMMTLKIHERGEGDVKLVRNGLVPKFGMEGRMMDFLKRFAQGGEGG